MGRLVAVATADIHSPRNLPLLRASLSDAPKTCDLILWAGDMVLRGRIKSLKPVLNAFKKRYPGVPIFSVFGNEEYWGLEEKFRAEYPEVTWLNDEYKIVEIRGLRVAIIGTRGALDRPTSWQRRNKPELWDIYREKPKLVERLVSEARTRANYVVLISHYALSFKTVEGEPRRIWPEMGSRAMEEALKKAKPDLALHGHSHNAKRTKALVEGVPIYNVSLPALRRIAILELAKPKSLLDFLS